MPPRYLAVAAMAANRVIGRDGRLPWRLPDDLKFFRELTMGHPIVMGRRTWDSLGRPLPGRRNIVLSRGLADAAGAEILRSPHELDALGLDGDVFVIGGAEVYRLLLPRCAGVYLTVLEQPVEGDTILPPFEADFPRVDVLRTIDGVAEWRFHQRAS